MAPASMDPAVGQEESPGSSYPSSEPLSIRPRSHTLLPSVAMQMGSSEGRGSGRVGIMHIAGLGSNQLLPCGDVGLATARASLFQKQL